MTKEEIKNCYSMRDILEKYGLAQPNKSGFIRCPFHEEKTASMKIYKDSYYCFGCGASGDIFSMVQHMNNLTFKEAFSELGGDYDHSFSSRLKMYRAQKEREMKRKTEQQLKEKKDLNNVLISVYRKYVNQLPPFSKGWGDCYNALQYQLYLHELLNNPEGSYEGTGKIEQADNPCG
jgi:DNA primase